MLPHRLALVTGAFLLSLAVAARADVHKDTRLGFQFNAPRDFQAVALSAYEGSTVAKYQSTKKSTSSGHTARYNTLRVFFYPASGIPGGQTREAYREATAERLEEANGFCDDVQEREFVVARLPALERILEPESKSIKIYQLFIDAEDGLFVFSASAFKERFDKELGTFRKAAKSFKCIDKEDRADHDAERAQLSSREKYLLDQVERLPPGWKSRQGERQLLLYNADKDFADDVARNLVSIREAFEEAFPTEQPLDYTQVVRVCDSSTTANAYSGGTRSELRSTNVGELVTYPRAPEARSHMLLRYYAYYQHATFYHGTLTPHPWYAKGHADYFAGAEMSATWKIKEFTDQPSPWAMRPTLEEALRLTRQGETAAGGGLTPLKLLMSYGWEEYRERFNVHEAQGWALIHMLREHRLPREEWQQLLTTYLDNMQAARDEVALETMQAELEKYEKYRKIQGRYADEDEEPPSDDPGEYYAKLDNAEVQRRAYEATFGDWTDEDWQALQDFYITYAKRL